MISFPLPGAAEKRDWTWVDSLEVMDRVEGGSCRVRDLSGERIHLLPRLALTLRAYLRSVIGSIRSGSLPGAMLLVPLQSASRYYRPSCTLPHTYHHGASAHFPPPGPCCLSSW